MPKINQRAENIVHKKHKDKGYSQTIPTLSDPNRVHVTNKARQNIRKLQQNSNIVAAYEYDKCSISNYLNGDIWQPMFFRMQRNMLDSKAIILDLFYC